MMEHTLWIATDESGNEVTLRGCPNTGGEVLEQAGELVGVIGVYVVMLREVDREQAFSIGEETP